MSNSNNDPSRVEIILTDILNKLPIGVNPQSRVEALLILLADAISAGGITIDTQMDPASSNPVSNSAIVAFINSSIATQTANFIGTFQSLSDLENYSGTVTNNDYAFVVDVDQAGNTVFRRYKYNSDNDEWLFEYNLNNSTFTAAQWATIQSGFTSADKDKLNGIEAQANKTVVDNALSSSSENPVQNKVINSALANKADTSDLTDLADNVSDIDNRVDVIEEQLDHEVVDNALSSSSENPVQNKVINSALDNITDTVSDIANRVDVIEERLDHETVVYGWHVDPDESDPADAITYLKDAVGMTPAAMGASTFSYGSWTNVFFMPKPCMLKFDGTVDYYLDPNDYSKKADGTASDVADPTYEGNAMMEWPLIWWKYESGTKEGEGYFFCSNRKIDDTYKCWCNFDSKNQIIDHFYTAIYNGTGTDKLRSISGVQLTSANGSGNTDGTTELNRALANNTTEDVEWYIDVWADRMLINGLLILIGKSLDSQGVFGRGIDDGGQTSKEAYVTGTLDDKGLFYGNISGSSTAVKVFGMENWWGLVWRRTAGLVGLANGTTAVKMTYGTADGTTVEGYNTTGNGYYIDTNIRPSSGFVSKVRFNALGFYLPITIGASVTTKWCDYWYTDNSALTYALVGGGSSSVAGDGLSYFDLGDEVSIANWGASAAPSCKPCKKG
jgi:hypothetical protein